MTKETKLKRKVSAYLDGCGEFVWHCPLPASGFGRRGIPDHLVVIHGAVLFLEMKSPGKRPTPLQRHTLAKISLAGANTAVVETLEEVQDLVERML